ncbi:MAG: undecaprenyl-diphosphatase UppP [Ignavibacteriae bacterium]|nr:undecaprenyl-diphosphatase UppP [Ignavibacteriota bacterium]NOG96921.1 undecaprenyl-diphosphatase UppP [Ignavibacteriota bacterium]
MTIIEAIFLGILQGLTEFLPISSTGHLTVAGKLMGLIDDPAAAQWWTAFIAVTQLGTLLAILIYFWKDLWNISVDFLTDNIFKRKKFSEQNFNSKLGWYIILGTIPVVIIGLGFKDIIEGAFTKDLRVIGASLIGLGVLLALSEKVGKFEKELKSIKMKDALLIGLAQCLALIPGSSRSGTTITAGLFLGLKRETAARFSFLLSVPAILGSGVLQFIQEYKNLDQSELTNLIIATIFAAISGYLTIAFLLNFLKKHTTYLFVFYRIVIGVGIFILIWFNIIMP